MYVSPNNQSKMKSSNIFWELDLGTPTPTQDVAVRMSPAVDNVRTLILWEH